MEVIERKVLLPEHQSFIIRQIELKDNQGVIHCHNNKYELNYIIDAVGRRFVSGNIGNFGPGDLLFMAPGVPHSWEIDNKDEGPQAITIHFLNEIFDETIHNIPELGFIKDLLRKSQRGLHLKQYNEGKLMDLFQESMNSQSSFNGFILVLEILKFISQIEDSEMLEVAEFNWNTDLPQNQRLQKVYEYVFFNFQNSLKLGEVASKLGLTEGAFCAFFKKSTRKTFSHFVKEVRIGYACKLLREDPDKPISQICFDSGYNNFANFNRQFKEISGLNPKAYRDRIQL
jgi:AraC-like DNA-binding protein/quercetin dioxygenase-like cupin family protein